MQRAKMKIRLLWKYFLCSDDVSLGSGKNGSFDDRTEGSSLHEGNRLIIMMLAVLIMMMVMKMMMMVMMMVMKIRIEFVDGCVCPREFVETENSKISLLVNQNQLSFVCTTTNYTNVNYNCLLFATLGQSEKKSFSENREKQLRQIRSRPPVPPPPIQISSCLDGLKYDSPNQSYIVFQLVFGADK